MKIPLQHSNCPKCGGSGAVSSVDGPALRKIRESVRPKISRRKMAALLDIGHTYLADMERGRRPMSEEIAGRIMEICHV